MRTIVIGTDGAIGSALAAAMRARGDEVFGTSRRADAPTGVLHLDLADPAAGQIEAPPADVAVFCAAMVRFDQCRANPALARQVNVKAPSALARRLADRGTRVVVLSTSAVYDGREPRVSVATPTTPVTEYGALKAEAEARFLALGQAARVVRLTKVLEPRQALFLRWIEALTRSEAVSAFSDLGLAPISMHRTVRALLAIAADPAGGIYQVSAAGDISYADAARHIARRLGVPADRVIEQRGADVGVPAEQLKLLSSLDASRVAALTGEATPDPLAVIDEVFGAAIAAARVGAAT